MKTITEQTSAPEVGTKIPETGYSQIHPTATCTPVQEYDPALMQESFVVGVLQSLGKLRVNRDGIDPDQLAEIRAVLFELQKNRPRQP